MLFLALLLPTLLLVLMRAMERYERSLDGSAPRPALPAPRQGADTEPATPAGSLSD